MIKGVIFDADGVLLDSMRIWDEAADIYIKKMGKIPEEGLAQQVFSMSLEECAQYLTERYDLGISRDEGVTGILKVVEDFYRYEVKLKPGIKDFLEEFEAKGLPLVIATSNNKELLHESLKRNGIDRFFKDIFTCSEYDTTKYEADIYNIAARSMGLESEETLVIEDTVYSLRTSKKAGFTITGVYDEYSKGDTEEIRKISDYYLPDFSDTSGFWKFMAEQ
jgi:HAD superfamily hydrolase (TIGR01509 family)